MKIYPAFPPSQLNASYDLSRDTMFTGETFWVNGTSKYWNSTSHPNDFSQLLPADECNVTVKLNGVTYATGWTDVDGNYAMSVTAPTVPGPYTVNVTVSNTTANRDVPCKSAEQQITVNAHALDVTLALNSTATLPGQQLWANGTVELDSGSPEEALMVNLTVEGAGISWFANTTTEGAYTSQFTAPDTVGAYTVNATVWHPTHDVRGWAEADFSVLATPLPDLAVTAADIARTGALLQGETQWFNITVRNSGIAPAADARINVSMDGALLNSTVHDIPNGGSVTIPLSWIATPGGHNISVFADPLNLIEESSEANNKAWKLFTIAPRTIGITLGLSASDVEPAMPMWANGTVTMDGVPAPAGIQVNVSIDGTEDYWLVATDASGDYSAAFDAYGTEGEYTVNASVVYPGYALTAWATDDFTAAIPPAPDLAVTNADITIVGNLTNGTVLHFNVVVRNIGTAAANGVQVNVSIDGVLLSSVRQNIAAGGQRLMNVSWDAANGTYNLTVDVDREGKFTELSDTNNHAWKVFTVAPTPPPDGGDDDEEPEGTDDGGSDNTVLFAIIIIVIIAIIAAIMLLKRGKAPAAAGGPEEAMPGEGEPQPPGEAPKP